MKDEIKDNRIRELFQQYLDEDYIDPVPDNRIKLIEWALEDAEDYNSYDDVIEILESNRDTPFYEVIDMIDEMYPELEIVEDDEISPDDEDYFPINLS